MEKINFDIKPIIKCSNCGKNIDNHPLYLMCSPCGEMKWISVKDKLPEFNLPVICIVKNSCNCDHYSPVIFCRIKHKNKFENYAWANGGKGSDVFHPHDVLYWRYLPPLPDGMNLGIGEH